MVEYMQQNTAGILCAALVTFVNAWSGADYKIQHAEGG